MSYGLNIRNMIHGELDRLRYIERFSTCYVVHHETVAEHSYYVALYSLLVCDWCNAQGPEGLWLDPARVLRKAILHDVEEARTGDIFRPLKTDNPELKPLLRKACERELPKIFSDFLEGDSRINRYVAECSRSKSCPQLESKIVEFADFLSVLGYVLQEVEANRQIRRHCHELTLYIRNFDHSKYDFIRPLVDQTQSILDDVFEMGNAPVEVRDSRM